METPSHRLLKNKRGKIYKNSVETRLKISMANKGRKLNCGRKKGQTGIQHPFYKHGMESNRDMDPEKLKAWILGVKQKNGFKCFITGETNKKKFMWASHGPPAMRRPHEVQTPSSDGADDFVLSSFKCMKLVCRR